MRKTILVSITTLVLGFALGFFGRFYLFPSSDTAPLRATMTTVSSTALPQSSAVASIAASEEEESFDRTDNTLLTARAAEVLQAIAEKDYTTLSTFVHPEKGVTFTPYSTVQPDIDLCFTPGQIAGTEEDTTPYVWGVVNGSTTPLTLTLCDYFDQYVYNADFIQAPQIGIDSIIGSGNAMENVIVTFPQGRFVEYHFPSLVAENLGYDWCSLKLVFEVYQNQWMLVGLIHSQWTA